MIPDTKVGKAWPCLGWMTRRTSLTRKPRRLQPSSLAVPVAKRWPLCSEYWWFVWGINVLTQVRPVTKTPFIPICGDPHVLPGWSITFLRVWAPNQLATLPHSTATLLSRKPCLTFVKCPSSVWQSGKQLLENMNISLRVGAWLDFHYFGARRNRQSFGWRCWKRWMSARCLKLGMFNSKYYLSLFVAYQSWIK